jgi:hypothetical protein
MTLPSTAGFRATVSAGGVLGTDATLKDVKAAKVIWGHFVIKMKGNTDGKKVVKALSRFPQSSSSSIEMSNWQLMFLCQQTHLLHDL